MSCTCSKSTQQHASGHDSHRFVDLPLWRQWLAPVTSLLMLVGGHFLASYITPIWWWYVLAYLPVAVPVICGAWERLLERDFFNEFTLMVVATVGAFAIGEYAEAVAVMLFYSVGEYLQDRAISKAERNVTSLLDACPDMVMIAAQGLVAARAVQVGEIMEVKPGERVALDAELVNDWASFNTAALTGESVPRTIRQGEEVLAGMINMEQVCQLRVLRPYDESAVARMVELVKNASARKAPMEAFIRRFARVYTPIVMALAVAICVLPYLYSLWQPGFAFDFTQWLYRALVFLVISCPCALIISIPLGYFVGIGATSKHGILVKGGNYLDALAHVKTVAFDKTGTLTKGVFEISQVKPADGYDADTLLTVVASVERYSTHPIAKAIVGYANTEPLAMSGVREYIGHGLVAELNGDMVCVGNVALLSRFGVKVPVVEGNVGTIVYCSIKGEYAGCLTLADVLRDDALPAIKSLKRLGIRKMVMLSGDKQDIVCKFANELGLDQAFGELLPEDKVKRLCHLKETENGQVAFVGDGMNDAPVLAMSDVGIAMGALGSDTAIETADVVVQADCLERLPMAISIANKTLRIVRQNVALAFGMKLIILILGAGGHATLWEAVFADVGVAILAIFNALRIRK